MGPSEGSRCFPDGPQVPSEHGTKHRQCLSSFLMPHSSRHSEFPDAHYASAAPQPRDAPFHYGPEAALPYTSTQGPWPPEDLIDPYAQREPHPAPPGGYRPEPWAAAEPPPEVYDSCGQPPPGPSSKGPEPASAGDGLLQALGELRQKMGMHCSSTRIRRWGGECSDLISTKGIVRKVFDHRKSGGNGTVKNGYFVLSFSQLSPTLGVVPTFSVLIC